MPTYKDLYYAATDDLANVINRKAGTTGKKDIPLMLQAAESIKSIEDGTLPVKTAADLTASGDTVTVPVGYYASEAQKAVSHGSATTPATSITANPTITVDSQTGAISASVSESESVTPTVVPGYVASGTSGTVSVSGSASKQLPVQGAQTITPTTTDQTIAGGKYLTGAQKIEAVVCENLTAENIKKDVVVKVGTATDDDSVVEIIGEYEGGGGGDVSYSELITATYGGGSIPVPSNYKYVAVNPLSVNQNDTYNAPDNTAYDPVVVAVSGGGGKDHTFDIPTISGSYTYDGTPHIPTITGFYSDFMTLSGDVSETNAGSYMITVTLKDTTNCEWRDTTTTAKTLSWSIAKAALPKPTLSAATLSLNADNLTGTFTVSRLGDGAISATSADTSKVTASVSGDTVTVTLVDTTAVGSTVNITVMVAEGTNYLAYSATDVVCEVSITSGASILTVTGLGNSDPSTVTFTTSGATFNWNFTTQTDANNNVFIKIPTMYRKVNTVSNGQITSFSIADAKVDNDYQPYPCFLDTDGITILQYVYIGKYCMSSASVANSVNSSAVTQTLANGRTNARALGTGYQLYDWQLQRLFIDLAMMKAQKVNFQDGIATISNYLGIAHLDKSCFVDGFYHNDTTWYVCSNPTKYVSEPSSNQDGYGSLSYAAPTTSSSEIQSLGYDSNNPFVNLPSAVVTDTSYNTYYCDGYYYNSSSRPCESNVGHRSAGAGLWNCDMASGWSGSFAARLCYRPISST